MEKMMEVEFRIRVQSEGRTETHIQMIESWYSCKKDISWLGLEPTLDSLKELKGINSFVINGRRQTMSMYSIDLDTKAIVFEMTMIWAHSTKKKPFDPEGWELIRSKVASEKAIRTKKPTKAIEDDDDEDDY